MPTRRPDEANGKTRLSRGQKRALETASLTELSEAQHTVVSNADAAKVQQNLRNLAKELENKSNRSKTFLGDVAKALGAKRYGSKSQYTTFETKNGLAVTVRLADHNASTRKFDNAGIDEGISFVVSPKENAGVEKGGKVAYEIVRDGVTYTVTTECSKSGLERFTNFYTNRKPIAVVNGTLNTDEQHVPQQSVSGAKLHKVSEKDKRETEKIFDAAKKRFGVTHRAWGGVCSSRGVCSDCSSDSNLSQKD